MEKVVIVSRGPIIMDFGDTTGQVYTVRYSHCKQQAFAPGLMETEQFQVPVCNCPEFALQSPLVGCRHIKALMGQSLKIVCLAGFIGGVDGEVSDRTIAVPLMVMEGVQTFLRYNVATIAGQDENGHRRNKFLLPQSIVISVQERINIAWPESLLAEEDVANPLYGMPLYSTEWTTFEDLQDHTFSVLETVRSIALDEGNIVCQADWHNDDHAIQRVYRDFEGKVDSQEYLFLLSDMWAIVRRGICLKCAHAIPTNAEEALPQMRGKVTL